MLTSAGCELVREEKDSRRENEKARERWGEAGAAAAGLLGSDGERVAPSIDSGGCGELGGSSVAPNPIAESASAAAPARTASSPSRLEGLSFISLMPCSSSPDAASAARDLTGDASTSVDLSRPLPLSNDRERVSEREGV